MCDEYIAILDSGVGGLNVLKNIYKRFPNERFLYYGDSDNAPYGNKPLNELWEITKQNIDFLKQYKIKILVLGCNTLSTCLYNQIKDYAKVPVIGVFPPVKYALKNYNNVLLLSTVRTAEQYLELDKRLKVVGFSNLAKDIETNIKCLKNVNFAKHLLNSCLSGKEYYDAVILGCTHYAFIKKQIFDHLKPQVLFGSEDFVCENIEKYLQYDKSSENYKRFNVLFFGGNAKSNKKLCVKSGFLW